EIVQHVVENLLLEPLLDDARRRLAGAEAGNARLLCVVLRDPIDLAVDDVAGDFDADGLPRFVDVGELCLHSVSAPRGAGPRRLEVMSARYSVVGAGRGRTDTSFRTRAPKTRVSANFTTAPPGRERSTR